MSEGLRKIIHIDMDAFYASVEQRDDPALRGRPVAVGGSSRRGVVAAASYEARTFGVRSAMPSVTAARRCPGLIFVKARFDVYKAVSRQIRDIFSRYTDLIEPLSLDEAYLDVSGAPSARAIAEDIRAAIFAETGLTASAGVSYNKFIAKLASDQRKPNGLCVITPDKGPPFVQSLGIERFHGVGPATAAKMHRLGIFTGADLAAREIGALRDQFGKAADYYFAAARGIDDRQVRSDRPRKSIGSETTFDEDVTTTDALVERLPRQVENVWRHCERLQAFGRTATVKVKFCDFRQITRSKSGALIAGRDDLLALGESLIRGLDPLRTGVRLLGVTVSNFDGEASQTALSGLFDRAEAKQEST